MNLVLLQLYYNILILIGHPSQCTKIIIPQLNPKTDLTHGIPSFTQENVSSSSDASVPQGSSFSEHVTNRTYGCISSCPGGYLFTGTRDNVRSVAMEWQLVCEREYLMRTAVDVYYVGSLLGGLVAGILADRIGRLPVLAICLYAQGTMAVALYVIQVRR